MTRHTSTTRRTLLRATAAAIPVALAGCSGSGSSGTPTAGSGSGSGSGGGTPTSTATPDGGSGGTPSFGGWMDNVSNYDGVVDETGSDAVTIEVGVDGNDGAYAFGPAAVTVSAGTTVTWKWTGQGGSHNVVNEGGSFESDMYGEAGATFERTFDSPGTIKYYCMPHKAMGMKGVVVVE